MRCKNKPAYIVTLLNMEGNIFINGEIGVSVHLVDVVKQVQGQRFATSFNVHINSVGGVVDVGFDIYNYLKSLPVPITTIGTGVVASIATVIFMAGSERKLRKNTEFMIHLPSGSVSGTSSDIEAYSELIKKYDKKLIDFYVDVTGLQKEAIEPFLKNETWLTIDDAFDFKFVTEMEIDFPMVAKAVYNLNTNTNMTNLTNEDKSWIEQKFDAILNKFGAKKVQNIVLQDSTGVELEFPEVADGEEPAIKSTVLVAGEKANGEYIMPDGSTYVCVDGLLEEIKPMEEEAEDVDAMKLELDALRKEKAEMTTALAEQTELVNSVKKEVLALKKTITSKATIDAKSDGKKDEDADTLREGQKALNNLLKSKRK